MRRRVSPLVLLALILVVPALIVVSGYVGAAGTPHETLGRTPDEWRTLLNITLVFGVLPAYVGTWVGGVQVLAHVNPATSTTRCLACGYAKAGLASAVRCPECGVTDGSPPSDFDKNRRIVESFGIWFIGAVGLFFGALAIYPPIACFAVFHVGMSFPAAFIAAFDRRLTRGQATFTTAAVVAGIILGTLWGLYDAAHSTDAQAALGIIGASFAGWMCAGPTYLLAAIAVRVAARRAARDDRR